jgi:hypothetical protein
MSVPDAADARVRGNVVITAARMNQRPLLDLQDITLVAQAVTVEKGGELARGPLCGDNAPT